MITDIHGELMSSCPTSWLDFRKLSTVMANLAVASIEDHANEKGFKTHASSWEDLHKRLNFINGVEI